MRPWCPSLAWLEALDDTGAVVRVSPLPVLTRAASHRANVSGFPLPEQFNLRSFCLFEPEADGGYALVPLSDEEPPVFFFEGRPVRSRLPLRDGAHVAPTASSLAGFRFREDRDPALTAAWARVNSPESWSVLSDLLLEAAHPLAEVVAHNQNPFTAQSHAVFRHGFPVRACIDRLRDGTVHPLMGGPWCRFAEALELDFLDWYERARDGFFNREAFPNLKTLLLTNKPVRSAPFAPPEGLQLKTSNGPSAVNCFKRFVEWLAPTTAVIRAYQRDPELREGPPGLISGALHGLFATEAGQALQELELDPRSFDLSGVSQAAGSPGLWLRLIEMAVPPPGLKKIRLGPFPQRASHVPSALRSAETVLALLRTHCPKVELVLLSDDKAWLEWKGAKTTTQKLEPKRRLRLEGSTIFYEQDRWVLEGDATVNGRSEGWFHLRSGDQLTLNSGLTATVRLGA